MKCLIIAAGQGTRLRSMAESKPLAQVNGIALIEHVIRAAAAGGAEEFVVVTGYEAPGIETFLADLSARLGLRVETVHNPDWHRPNGVSVLAAAGRLDSEFLLLMSDHLFDPDIVRRLMTRRGQQSGLTLACDYRLDNPLIDPDDVTKVKSDADGRIMAIGKALEDFNAADTGIFLATPALFDALRQSMARGGLGSLSEGVQILADASAAHAFDIGDGWWIDVDDEAAHARAEASFASPPDLTGRSA